MEILLCMNSIAYPIFLFNCIFSLSVLQILYISNVQNDEKTPIKLCEIPVDMRPDFWYIDINTFFGGSSYESAVDLGERISRT